MTWNVLFSLEINAERQDSQKMHGVRFLQDFIQEKFTKM